MKNIINCHYCAAEGIKQNLAELLPNGMLKIQRFDSFTGNREFTVIRGDKLDLICGNCGNIVYQQKGGQNEVSNNRQQGVFRFTLVNTIIKFGTPSITDYAGTII